MLTTMFIVNFSFSLQNLPIQSLKSEKWQYALHRALYIEWDKIEKRLLNIIYRVNNNYFAIKTLLDIYYQHENFVLQKKCIGID